MNNKRTRARTQHLYVAGALYNHVTSFDSTSLSV